VFDELDGVRNCRFACSRSEWFVCDDLTPKLRVARPYVSLRHVVGARGKAQEMSLLRLDWAFDNRFGQFKLPRALVFYNLSEVVVGT
jgi:hypothetical protein